MGTATASKYRKAYFYRDYGVSGADGGKSHRVIVPDCNRYKDPASATDNAAKTITLTIEATATDDFAWTKGVYDLEMISATGKVTAILSGRVSVSKEVTT